MKRICHEAVVPVLVSENEVIFSADEVPSEPPQMIFVEKGLLKYQLDDEAVQDVRPGQWISEQVLWTNWVYQGTLWSVTPCRLLMLNAQELPPQVLSTKAIQGTLNVDVSEYATGFLKELNESGHEACCDLGSYQACAQLEARISGSNLQDAEAEAPRRNSGASLQESLREFHAWLGAKSPEQPGSRSDSRHTSRGSLSPVRARCPWRPRRDAPVAPAQPAAPLGVQAPPLTDVVFTRATSVP
ncbi:unnamed protein product [Prorocentrum cordatum]|uniref:Uncharacterized protein n=1 Tax=Prorocentrum cordatum TaxID=2364126 RepID=A0ABN9RC56_9DINO|nr:unnamed protein product [Polarella glacialis]